MSAQVADERRTSSVAVLLTKASQGLLHPGTVGRTVRVVLVQPMASLTDFALGLVSLYLVRRLPRGGELSRHWRAAFAWAAGTALAGAVYHGVLVGVPRVSDLSWAVM